jgi:hypothetical protein
MIAGFLPLLVLAAIVYGVVRLIGRRNADAEGVSPEGDLREIVGRMFRLGLLAAALALLAEGLSALIAEALPRSAGELARDPLRIAQALSFTIVGAPAAAGLAWWTRKELRSDEREARSVVWAGFLGASLIVALIVVLVNIGQVFDWLFADGRLDQRALGRTIVWSVVTGGFWWLNRQRPGAHTATHTPAYVLAGSVVGLAVTGFQVWELGRALIRSVLDQFWDDVIIGQADDEIFIAAMAVVGVALWLWFWWFDGRLSARTDRWYTYVLLVGVLSGVVTAIWAAGLLINVTLQWFFGDPSSDTAANHFESLPGGLSALIVGGAIWFHHRSLLGGDVIDGDGARRKARTRIEPDRIYDYLGSVAGLVLIATAVSVLVSALVEAVAGGDVVQASVANTVIDAFTFALIGVPLIALFWGRAQRVAAGDVDEKRSPTRRVYLISTLGGSAAAALISLVICLTIFFEDLAGGDLSLDTLYRTRFGLGVIVTTVAISAYHFLVYRRDREEIEAAAPPPPVVDDVTKVPASPRLVVTTDLQRAQALLDDPSGPDAVVVTRHDDVDLAGLLEAKPQEWHPTSV